MVHTKTIAPHAAMIYLITTKCLFHFLLLGKFIPELGKYCKQPEVRRIASVKEQSIYGKVSLVLLLEAGQ